MFAVILSAWTLTAGALAKIDSNGQYLPFNGTTVVSFFKAGSSKVALHQLYEFMASSELVQPFCAVLPEDSWHVTTHNLWVESSFTPNAWNGFIEDNLGYFRRFSERLRGLTGAFEATYVDLYVGPVVQLLFDIPSEWNEKLRKIGTEFDVVSGIPSKIHTTLCYFYKEIKPEQTDQLTKAIREKIESIAVAKPWKLELQQPELSYFKSMKEFVPWNGEKHPFIEEKKEVKKRLKNIYKLKKDSVVPATNPSPTITPLKKSVEPIP